MNPDTAQAKELAELALHVAREAAQLASQGFRSRSTVVSRKGAIDLVTEYDTRGEALIVERLTKHAPEIPIVGEEGGGQAGAELTFYVDPIDGTTNFAHGHPFWCVSIGIADAQGRSIGGAVVAPALHTEWMAWAGGPCLRNGEACQVSGIDEIDGALLATGFPYDRRTSPQNNFAEFIAMKKRAQGIRRGGSAALDLCFVADGTFEGYWERKLKPWDVAAAACCVTSAGGRITDFADNPLDVRHGNVIASNGLIHDELVRSLAEVAG